MLAIFKNVKISPLKVNCINNYMFARLKLPTFSLSSLKIEVVVLYVTRNVYITKCTPEWFRVGEGVWKVNFVMKLRIKSYENIFQVQVK